MANGGVKGPCLSPVQRSSLQRWLGAVGRGCAALFLVAAVLIVSAVQQAWAQTSPLVDPEKGRTVTGKLPDIGGTQHGFSQVFGSGFHPSNWAGLLRITIFPTQNLIPTGAAIRFGRAHLACS